MLVSLYVICAALAVSVRSEENNQRSAPVPDSNNFLNRENSVLLSRLLEPMNMVADAETVNYILPKLVAKYRPNDDWRSVTDPRFYMLSDMESNNISPIEEPFLLNTYYRNKKQILSNGSSRIGENGGSLSIVNSLDVLRNRLLLEIARKKAKEGANRNRQILKNLGKRSPFHVYLNNRV